MADNNSEIGPSLNLFTFKLFNKLSEGKNENFFISPFSISTALAMCFAGAKSQTAEQLKQLLSYDSYEKDDHLFAEIKAYLTKLNTEIKKDVSLHAANKLYPRVGYNLSQSYVENIKTNFFGDVQQLDYSNKEQSSTRINDWVAEKTKNKVKNLISPNAIQDNTELILVNAIYFKGDWLHQFVKEGTSKDDFFLADGSKIKVETMKLHGKRFSYAENPFGLDAKTVTLPYVGNNVVMTIILPNEGVSLEDFELNMSSLKIFNIFDCLLRSQEPSQRVNVHLPKFKLEYKNELSDHLKQLGAPLPFDANRADFTGINNESNDLHISKVIHQAVVEVNEEGTEAAAATGIMMMTRCALVEEDPLEFFVNRPFIFIISERIHNGILFIGKVVNPQ